MERLLSWTAVALVGANALIVGAMWVRRAAQALTERAHRVAEERARPLAVSLIEGEDVDPAGLSARQARALAQILERMARSVTGEARRRAVVFFQVHGYVRHELIGMRSRRASRRAVAAFALGDMGSSHAMDALVGALDDRSSHVRGAAARSLGRLAAAAAVEPLVVALVEGRITRPAASQALVSIGPPAMPTLRALLRDERADVRMIAIELVGTLGDAGDEDELVARLSDGSAEVRARAARALGRHAASHAADRLREALDDRVFYVRVAAAHALGAIGDRAALPALLELAGSDRPEVAAAAARAAARIDPWATLDVARDPGAGAFLHEVADLLEVRRR